MAQLPRWHKFDLLAKYIHSGSLKINDVCESKSIKCKSHFCCPQMCEQPSIVVDFYRLPCNVWSTELCLVLCTVLPISTVWHDFFFWWLNYMVNESFVTLYDKDTKPINFILLPANSTSKALLSQDCSGNSFLFWHFCSFLYSMAFQSLRTHYLNTYSNSSR